MNLWIKKYSFYIFLLLILLSVRIATFVEKEELHPDEVYSLTLAQHNKMYWAPPVDSTYQGADLKQMLVANHSYGEDMYHLWKSNGDIPHASLYYMCLRTALIGYDSYDIPEFALRGFILNSIFFIIAYILLFNILSLTIKKRSNIVILATLALAFGNTMSISNTLLIREYQLAEVAILLLTFLSIKSIRKIRCAKPISWISDILPLSVAISLTASTGYFNCFYIALLGLCLLIYSIFKHQYLNILKFICSGILGILIAWGMYLGFFYFLIHDTVHSTNSFSNFNNTIHNVFIRDLFNTYLGITGLSLFAVTFIIFIILLCRKKAHINIFFVIPIIGLITITLIQWGSLLKEPRYGYALISTISILMAYLLTQTKPLILKRIIAIITLIAYAIVPFFTQPSQNQYKWKENQAKLSSDMTIYYLNSVQFIYLIPYLSDTAHYHVTKTDIKYEPNSSVISISELPSKNLNTTYTHLKPTYFVVSNYQPKTSTDLATE